MENDHLCLSLLIVGPSDGARGELRHDTEPFFKRVEIREDFQAAGDWLLEEYDSCDVVFIAGLPAAECIDFIRQCREIRASQDAAFVRIADRGVADGIPPCFDASLMLPATTDKLIDILNLAPRIRMERRCARQRTALQSLLKEIVRQLDDASAKSKENKLKLDLVELKQACAPLKLLKSEELHIYFELAIAIFDEAVRERTDIKPQTCGLNRRIRRNMIRKIVADGVCCYGE